MHCVKRTKVLSEYDYSPAPQSPIAFEDLVDTIADLAQKQLINLENYSSGWFGLYPKRTQTTFHSQVRQILTLPLEEKKQILTEKIERQKEFIEKLEQTNHHELKTAVHGIVHSAKDSLESFQDIQRTSEKILTILEKDLETYKDIIELIETDLDISELSEKLANLGSPKSRYQDRFFFLAPKKPTLQVQNEPENLADRLQGILETHEAVIAPRAKEEIQQLSQRVYENNILINQLMGQNTEEIRETLKIISRASSEPLHSRKREIVSQASDHLLQLFYEGVDFQEAITGNIRLEKAEFSLEDLLHQIKSEYEKKHPGGIDLHFHMHDVPPLLIGDPRKTETIIKNALFATLHSGKEGRVDIFIRSEHISEEKSRLHITVNDTSSFPEKKVHQKFSTPTGLKDCVTRRHFVAGKLLEEMEGNLTSFSLERKESTTFSFHMTLEKPLSRIISTERVISVEEAQEKLRGKRMLIVDDTPLNVKILKMLLQKHGIIVETAENGLIGYEKIQADPNFDLVLMDLQMPVMDGLESAKAIRAWEQAQGLKSIPIIALSANNPAVYRQLSLDAGMDDFAEKPCRAEKLFPLMYSLISEREEKSLHWEENGYQKLLALDEVSRHPSRTSPDVEDLRSPSEKIHERIWFQESLASKLSEAATEETVHKKS